MTAWVAIANAGCFVAPPIEQEDLSLSPIRLLPEASQPPALPGGPCLGLDVAPVFNPDGSQKDPPTLGFSLSIGALDAPDDAGDLYYFWYQHDLPGDGRVRAPEFSGRGLAHVRFEYDPCRRDGMRVTSDPPTYRLVELEVADRDHEDPDGKDPRAFPEGTRSASLLWCVQHTSTTGACAGLLP